MNIRQALLNKQAKLGRVISRPELARMITEKYPDLPSSVPWITDLFRPSKAGKVKPSARLKAALEDILGEQIDF